MLKGSPSAVFHTTFGNFAVFKECYKALKPVMIVLCSLFFILYLYFARRSGKMVRSIVISAVVGTALYLLLHIFGKNFGFTVPLNTYNIGVSAALGTPGVVLILLYRFIF